MSAKRLSVALISALIMLTAAAVAQDEKNEIGGNIGRTFISDQGIKGAAFFDPIIHFGKPLTFVGEFAHRFFVTPVFAISGELPVAFTLSIKPNAGAYPIAVVPQALKATFLTPGVRVTVFPTTAVEFWGSAGVGVGHFSQSSNLVYGGVNPGKSTTAVAAQFGAGLDVKVWKKVWARGELRDFWSGEPDFPLASTGKTRQHNYFVGAGFLYRF